MLPGACNQQATGIPFSRAQPERERLLGLGLFPQFPARFSSLQSPSFMQCAHAATQKTPVSRLVAFNSEPEVLVDTLTGRRRRERQCMITNLDPRTQHEHE